MTYIDTDEGSRYIGEVAFGTNYGIKKFSHNILFDEKIGGTMHMALGAMVFRRPEVKTILLYTGI